MTSQKLRTNTLIRALIGLCELIAIIWMSVVLFANDGNGMWGYWGSIFVVYVTLSPILVYAISSIIFNFFNLRIVFADDHTRESVERYYRASIVFFVWGVVTGALYGFILVPFFFLENVFLFLAYREERENMKKRKFGFFRRFQNRR